MEPERVVVLWELQFHDPILGRVEEQIPVPCSLLDHLCMKIIAPLPVFLPAAETVDDAGEVRLFVGSLGGELVEGKRRWDEGYCDVEASLLHVSHGSDQQAWPICLNGTQRDVEQRFRVTYTEGLVRRLGCVLVCAVVGVMSVASLYSACRLI